MRGISSLELSVLIGSLSGLVDYYVEKFYETGEDRFRLKFKKGGSPVNLFCFLGHTINLTEYIERADIPTNFSIAMRKRITGFRVAAVRQAGADRIIIFDLKKGDTQLNLIIEMFGKGNLVLTDSSMSILLAYKRHEFKNRTIAPHSTYMFPGISADLPLVNTGRVHTAPEDQSIMAVLSGISPLGPLYIEEALSRLLIDPKAKASSISDVQRKSIEGMLVEIDSESREGHAFVYLDGAGKPLNYSLVEIAKYRQNERKEFDGLQAALDFAYAGEHVAEIKLENPEIAKLKASIKRQEELLLGFDKEIELNRKAGEVIFANMGELNRLIKYLQENKRATKEELQRAFPDLGITDINLKDKTVTVILQ